MYYTDVCILRDFVTCCTWQQHNPDSLTAALLKPCQGFSNPLSQVAPLIRHECSGHRLGLNNEKNMKIRESGLTIYKGLNNMSSFLKLRSVLLLYCMLLLTLICLFIIFQWRLATGLCCNCIMQVLARSVRYLAADVSGPAPHTSIISNAIWQKNCLAVLMPDPVRSVRG